MGQNLRIKEPKLLLVSNRKPIPSRNPRLDPFCVLGDPVQFCRSRPFVRTKTLQPGRHKQTQHGDWNLGAPESDNWPWGFL